MFLFLSLPLLIVVINHSFLLKKGIKQSNTVVLYLMYLLFYYFVLGLKKIIKESNTTDWHELLRKNF